MTEEEAKTKWCPHMRISSYTGQAAINTTAEEFRYKCIASDCMMWVTKNAVWTIDGIQILPEQLSEALTPEDVGAVTSLAGHCGLIKWR